MLANIWRRGRLAALIGVGTAAVLAAGGATAGAAVAQSHSQAPAQAQATVPWSKVGPGWELATYSTPSSHGTTLYLAGPTGTKYALRTWRGSTGPGTLVAWSGDKSRAMFFNDVSGRVTQLNVMTGKTSSFILTGQTSPIAYTRPDGLNVLAVSASGSLERFSLTGKLQKVLLRNFNFDGSPVYNPNGETLAVSGGTGVRLINNATAKITNLKVPGKQLNCRVARWWNGSTILAECLAEGAAAPRLWLVPAGGGKVTALTPQRKSGYDLGDFDAWRLSSGLYLQSAGACGTIEINKQAANGSVTPVNVPGTPNTHNFIMTADGPRLLIYPSNGCQAASGLLWFNPAKPHAETWLFGYTAHARLVVVPFNSIENAPAL